MSAYNNNQYYQGETAPATDSIKPCPTCQGSYQYIKSGRVCPQCGNTFYVQAGGDRAYAGTSNQSAYGSSGSRPRHHREGGSGSSKTKTKGEARSH